MTNETLMKISQMFCGNEGDYFNYKTGSQLTSLFTKMERKGKGYIVVNMIIYILMILWISIKEKSKRKSCLKFRNNCVLSFLEKEKESTLKQYSF